MKLILNLVIVCCAVLVISACCKAGTGGNATVTCNAMLNGKPVKGVTIYIEYGSSKAPNSGIGGFDAHKTADPTSNSVTFTGLKCGTYYFYALGYDSIVGVPVSGGGPFSLLHKDRNKSQSNTMNVSY